MPLALTSPIETYAEQVAASNVLTIDTATEAGRLFMRRMAWASMHERQVGWALRAIPVRLEAHRGIQARVRQVLPLLGYYQSAAQSRSELVAAVRKAREVRDDFLRRWPEPVAAQVDRVAA